MLPVALSLLLSCQIAVASRPASPKRDSSTTAALVEQVRAVRATTPVVVDGVLSDAIWDGGGEAKVTRDAAGWPAEVRIPYSQLRFLRQSQYVWGINFRREIARKNEVDYIVYTPKNGSGFVSRFVDLVGIERITPPRRIELLPYVTSRAEFSPHGAGDPFNDGPGPPPGPVP